MDQQYPSLSEQDLQLITVAVEAGAAQYFQERREKIASFVCDIYSVKGSIQTNRKAFGMDMIRAPLNLFWAVPYLGIQSISKVSNKTGLGPIGRVLGKTPAGFKTRVQKEVDWRVRTELLELPYAQGDRLSEKDALLETILKQEAIVELLQDQFEAFDQHIRREDFDEALQRELDTYGSTRIAAADMACSMLNISAGAFFFKKLTPGAITSGSALAASLAQQSAISNFVFGNTLGSVYYSLFPAKASMGLVLASTASILAAMGVASAFSGILTDPFQRWFGIHQRRLNKIITSLEQSFDVRDNKGFHPKDHYLARIFDIFDFIKTIT